MPVELLIRGKDAEENTKQFERCTEIIKNAGVRVQAMIARVWGADDRVEEIRCPAQSAGHRSFRR